MSKTKTQPCPACGGEMRFEKRTDEVEVEGKTHSLETPGWWCSTCDEAMLAGDALREREGVFLDLKAQVDGPRPLSGLTRRNGSRLP